MKLYWKMTHRLKTHFKNELIIYRVEFKKSNLPSAWLHLERAHIIGQSSPGEQTYAHWLILNFAFRIKSGKNIFGQIPRLLVGGVKSFVGKIPVGNTGGAQCAALTANGNTAGYSGVDEAVSKELIW